MDPFYYDLDNELISLYILRKKLIDQGRARHYAAVASSSLDKKNEILLLNEKQITYVHSGHWDDSGKKKYRKPHIENGSRPYRQLALIEDATIIYMLVRAPERLVFNIDTGHLPPGQAEAYVKKQMGEFWNRKGVGRDGRVENVYDPMTLLENYYFAKPRGSEGSTVSSIGGGNASPDNIEILTLFINRLYKAMGVPLQRLNSETAFADGMDVTREELRFAKFIVRLRNKFSQIFDIALKTQLSLKGICSVEEWEQFKESIYYDYKKDNNFTELRESELMRERVQTLQMLDPYIGKYFSQTWAKKNVLRMTDEEIEAMTKEMEEDGSSELFQQSQSADTEGAPVEPVDNTIENNPTESLTPQLDSEVEKYSIGINR
jgi:hypothetical protein